MKLIAGEQRLSLSSQELRLNQTHHSARLLYVGPRHATSAWGCQIRRIIQNDFKRFTYTFHYLHLTSSSSTMDRINHLKFLDDTVPKVLDTDEESDYSDVSSYSDFYDDQCECMGEYAPCWRCCPSSAVIEEKSTADMGHEAPSTQSITQCVTTCVETPVIALTLVERVENWVKECCCCISDNESKDIAPRSEPVLSMPTLEEFLRELDSAVDDSLHTDSAAQSMDLDD